MRPKSGSIWFWDHELELIGRSEAGHKLHTRLAKNIDEFLDKLIDCRGEPLPEFKVQSVWIDADFAAEHNLKIPPGATVGRRQKKPTE